MTATTIRRLRVAGLVVIAGGSLVVGLWALGFPRSFYDDFPGMGRVWVAVDGPYNEHLVRDVGALNLAIGFVALLALVTRSTLVARAAGGAALVYGVPHLVYHVANLAPFDATDAAGIVVSLGIAAFAGLLAALPDAAHPDPAHPASTGDMTADPDSGGPETTPRTAQP